MERHFPRRASRVSVRLLPTCLAVLVVACGGSPAGDEEGTPAEVPTIVADVATVTRQTVLEELAVRGTIAALPNQDVKVSALVGGRVIRVAVAEGDSVREGQVVATLDPGPVEDQRREATAAVQQARAALENAQANLKRNQQLFEKGIAAGKEVEDAKKELATAEAGLEQTTAAFDTAQRQVGRAEVRSPISGQVVKRMVSGGEQVDGTAAQPILEIANLDRVELAATVPSGSLTRIKVGQTVLVSSDAYPGRDFAGAVVAIAPVVDPSTNAALVRVRITNPERLLKVGMFAQGRVQLSAHTDALVVPPPALVRSQDGSAAVYVVTGDVAERTEVKVGFETPVAIEILSGIKDGQMVLTSAVYGLGEKARITRPGSKNPDSEKLASEKAGTSK